MSGVIDDDGQQWEHCNVCGGWVKFERLGTVLDPETGKPILDICISCAAKGIESLEYDFDDVIPGMEGWVSVTMGNHDWDKDGVCKACGFDGTEWYDQKKIGHEPDPMPSCSKKE